MHFLPVCFAKNKSSIRVSNTYRPSCSCPDVMTIELHSTFLI